MEQRRDILLVCASRTEAAPLRALLSRAAAGRRSGAAWIWQIGGSRLRLLRTGVSMQRARQMLRATLFDHRRTPAGTPPAVIVFGIAGQLDPSVPVGSIVIPALWRCQTRTDSIACSPALLGLASRRAPPWAPSVPVRAGGAGVTLQRPALGRPERALLRRRYPDATICDMETFAVIEQFPGADCVAVRIVSDDGSEAAFSESGQGLRSNVPASQFCALLPGIREQCATLALFIGEMVHALAPS